MKFSADLGVEKLLNLFIANEFFAWQQYFLAKVVAKGKSLDYSGNVFTDNKNEELYDHFKELVEYAQSMGFDPEVNPKQMEENASAPYRELKLSQSTKELTELLIDEEKQAIEEYEEAAKGKAAKENPSLKFLFSEIAKDERSHLRDLEDLLSSIEEDSSKPKSDKKDDSDDEDDEEEEEDEGEKGSLDDKDEDEDEDEDEKETKSERKIGKDYDLAKDFKVASKKSKGSSEKKDDDDDEDGDSVNESVIGSYLNCEEFLCEAFK